MKDNDLIPSNEPAILTFRPSFVLLFSIHLNSSFKGFGSLPSDIVPLSEKQSSEYLTRLATFETKLLGKTFYETKRLVRSPLGRIAFNEQPKESPEYADVYLLTHKSGAALWEVWLTAPLQPFNTARWIEWLDPEAETGFISQIWNTLGSVNQKITGKTLWSGQYFPITLLRTQNHSLESILDTHGADLIHQLFLDHSLKAFKAKVVTEELSRDYCSREGGLTLLGRKSGLDVRTHEEITEETQRSEFPSKSTLPFLITLELLLLERMALTHLYGRLSHKMPSSIEELLTLKQEALDALEEYYGAITNATYFSDAVTTDGERLLGLNDLYDAVMDRLDMVSFTITTRYENRMTLLGLWLAVIFGATEIGFIASGVAAWYYHTELLAVLAWTILPSIMTAILLWLILRKKVQ